VGKLLQTAKVLLSEVTWAFRIANLIKSWWA